MKQAVFAAMALAGILAGFGGCDVSTDEATFGGRAAPLSTDVETGPDVPAADAPIVVQDVGSVDVSKAPRYRYVVVIADPHLKEADGLPAENMRKIGSEIGRMPWPVEAVFVLGDVMTRIPYASLQEYVDDPADRFDTAREIFDDYPVPVYPLIGNHDMDNGPVPLVELAEQLFEMHFGVDPYYAVDIGDFRFLLLSNFKGPTHVVGGSGHDFNSGSLGDTQLAWMQDHVDEGRPTILMAHYPPFLIQDIGEFMRDNSDTVRLMLAGHSHGWLGLSDHYGVPAMVVGTSQFDADCLMILELDNVLQTWRILNWDKFHWGTGYALPWDYTE